MEIVFRSREGDEVLVLRPVTEGSLLRSGGVWGPSPGITSWEMDEDWIPVRDESEASRLVKEATSALQGRQVGYLTYYRQLAAAHWEEFLPSRYREFQEAGELETAVIRAAELTDQEMTAAMDAGIPRDQAWESIKGHYLLLEPEPETTDEDDNPNRAFYELSQAIHQETQLVLEGKLDVAAKVAELNNEGRYEEATKLYHQSAD